MRAHFRGQSSRFERPLAVTDNGQDLPLEILKNNQAGMTAIKARIDKLEAGMRPDRRNVAGLLLTMRATAGDFAPPSKTARQRPPTLQ